MEFHPLARKTVTDLPLPGPLKARRHATVALHGNLLARSGPWRNYPDVLQSDLIDGVIRLWTEIELRKGGILNLTNNNVLLTRGGVDALDIALSIFCEPGRDMVAITPPSFEAFPHWAALHGLKVLTLAQRDWAAVAASRAKALLLCSPNNPLGTMISQDDIRSLLRAYAGIVILDEAYADFSEKTSAMSLVNEFPNLVVLRTLSKSFGLAGLRVGALVGHPSTIYTALRVQIPFCIPSPVRDALLNCLQTPKEIHEGIFWVRKERTRVATCLEKSVHVTHVHPSDSNFLCVVWKNPDIVRRLLLQADISVLDLENFSRITVGSRDANDAFLRAIN
jgi:histidinol-phosphate aminotransferase